MDAKQQGLFEGMSEELTKNTKPQKTSKKTPLQKKLERLPVTEGGVTKYLAVLTGVAELGLVVGFKGLEEIEEKLENLESDAADIQKLMAAYKSAIAGIAEAKILWEEAQGIDLVINQRAQEALRGFN